ncbi:hypothetical protein A3K63_02560 [Candidatus Micrarchaeota archaeon RBG_16_49_10]|nr:MAG: hypothetical protein A3K63_02560 [Candidatus Micrarchaeota archaeon RBG_16_49_10]
MDEKLSLLLEIIGWGLIGTTLVFIALKLVGVIHSPTESTLDTLLTTGILALLVETRVKIGLLWSDFKRRKNI